MHFVVDAQLPPALARLLVGLEHTAEHVAEHVAEHTAEHVADIGLRDAGRDSRTARPAPRRWPTCHSRVAPAASCRGRGWDQRGLSGSFNPVRWAILPGSTRVAALIHEARDPSPSSCLRIRSPTSPSRGRSIDHKLVGIGPGRPDPLTSQLVEPLFRKVEVEGHRAEFRRLALDQL